MTVLCDTNAITALRLGNADVREMLEGASRVYLSVVVLGELYFGYAKGSRQKENLAWLQAFLAKPTTRITPIGEETARIFADLRLELARIGKPIPTNDLWIASQCVEHGAVLLTADAHFDVLPGVRKAHFG